MEHKELPSVQIQRLLSVLANLNPNEKNARDRVITRLLELLEV